MAVAGMRQLRTPESVLLQAAGAFRELASASMISSGISIVAVVVFLLAFGPLWSIAGILIGEAVFAAWTWRQAAQYRNRMTSDDGSASVSS
jgi:Flp pilus assembly protein TadB